MESGSLVWVSESTEEAWTLGKVISYTSAELTISTSSNVTIRQNVKSCPGPNVNEIDATELKYEGVELAVTLSDKEKSEGKDDDITNLIHLHEPAMLDIICDRFQRGKIYTWAGSTLIAVNPFQNLGLYTDEIIQTYRQESLFKSHGMDQISNTSGPHIYAIADLSYRQMMVPVRKSQAILISGESGAGKTESARLVLSYITKLGTVSNDGKDFQVMKKILQVNPILEAFGNARTIRNNNSSRFGKFLEVGFDEDGHLVDTKVQTFLLEKVRVSRQSTGESNYHIFYQLLSSDMDHEGNRGHTIQCLHSKDSKNLAEQYHYTSQGGLSSLSNHSDKRGLKFTIDAMKSIGWDQTRIDKVLSLVAGLLYLGQINFISIEDNDGQSVASITDESVLQHASSLLDVKVKHLKAALMERILITREDEIVIRLSPSKALESRDILARTLYGALFSWIVAEVNKNMTGRNKSNVTSSIGVLDIFGFECFVVNSFEQLCINLANETLQQQFNTFIFKEKKIEYEREGICCDFIEFDDNQDCIDVLQGKHGILALIDDESRLGSRGSDSNWVRCLYNKLERQQKSALKYVRATPIQKSKSIFSVKHFAGVVEYTSYGFLDKNRDEISVVTKNLFHSSSSWLIKDMYKIDNMKYSNGESSKHKTVGRQFKRQLNSLVSKINSMEPHYIRCLKPNDEATPELLIRRRVVDQLRSGGMIEAARVARLGLPVKISHEFFYRHYQLLVASTSGIPRRVDKYELKSLCVRLFNELFQIFGSSRRNAVCEGRTLRQCDIKIGHSKVFMTKMAFQLLEGNVISRQRSSTVLLQAFIRGRQQRQKLCYRLLRNAAIVVQRCYRGYQARNRVNILRRGIILFQRVSRSKFQDRALASSKSQILQDNACTTRKTLERIYVESKVHENGNRCVLSTEDYDERNVMRIKSLWCLQIISLVWFGLLFFTVTILKHRSAIAGTVQILLFTITFHPLTFFPPTTTFCVD